MEYIRSNNYKNRDMRLKAYESMRNDLNLSYLYGLVNDIKI